MWNFWWPSYILWSSINLGSHKLLKSDFSLMMTILNAIVIDTSTYMKTHGGEWKSFINIMVKKFFFCKETDSNIFVFAYTFSVCMHTYHILCPNHSILLSYRRCHKPCVKNYTWLCSNNTLFIKTGDRLVLAWSLQIIHLWYWRKAPLFLSLIY